MRNNKGVILTITLSFVIVLSIIAGIAVLIMSNQARITETQIRRTRAFYAAQAAIVEALQALRTGSAVPASVNVNGLTANIVVGAPNSGPKNTRTVRANVNYPAF